MDEAAALVNGSVADAHAFGSTRMRAAASFRSSDAPGNGDRKDLAAVGRIGAQAAVSRRKQRIGHLTIELRVFSQQTAVDLRVSSTRALLIVPLRGSAEIIANGEPRLSCEAGTPTLLARVQPATAVWRRSSHAAFVYFTRSAVQVAATERLGDARRLAGANISAGPVGHPDKLEELVVRLAGSAGTPALDADEKALEATFYRTLVDRFTAREIEGLEAFPRSRTVNQAMQLVRDDHAEPWDAHRLAAAVGVTAATLRKNFKASLGMAITDYVCAVRLDWAHERLSSAMDSRSIGDLSAAAGFSSATTFARAYQRRFGEAPSQTRGRAVRTVK